MPQVTGELAALAPKRRGPKPPCVDERDARIDELEKQVAELTLRAERAESVVSLQKKFSEMMTVLSEQKKGKP